jgi:hypothetical protein
VLVVRIVLVSEPVISAVVIVSDPVISGVVTGSVVLVVQDVESIENVVDISTGEIELVPVVQDISTVRVDVTDDGAVDLW